jgi:DNA-binding NarL/FixJ family response regulator
MTTIVIADDQALFREGLRTLLSIRPDMDGGGEAANGDEAVALVEALRPNVVLMDLRMPGVDGIQATARIRERWPEIPVLVLTTFDDDASLFGALRAGAAGYLLKDVSSETLISAIQAATRGESFLQSTVTGRVVAAFARLMESGGPKAEALVLPLSPREREIVSLLGSGASNKEIADRLNLAEGTVKNHVTSILTKLDVRDRTQAARTPRPARDWRTRTDPFERAWPCVRAWLEAEPDRIGRELFVRLQGELPGVFPDGQLRTFQRRVREWRHAAARQLVFASTSEDAA